MRRRQVRRRQRGADRRADDTDTERRHACAPRPRLPRMSATAAHVPSGMPTRIAPQPRTLPRQLGLWSAVAVLIGSTIGSGIFRSPAGIADKLPGPLPLHGGLGRRRAVRALRRAHAGRGRGRAPADRRASTSSSAKGGAGCRRSCSAGPSWCIIRAASLGAISHDVRRVLPARARLRPGASRRTDYVHYVAAAAIVLTAIVQLRRRADGARSSRTSRRSPSTAGCCSSSCSRSRIGLPQTGRRTSRRPRRRAASRSAPFGLALVSVLWAFDGWADLTFVGGEVKDPRRNLPRALIIGTLAVIAIYLLANLAYLAVLPRRGDPDVAARRGRRRAAADRRAPAWSFVAVTVMLSTFGTLNGDAAHGAAHLLRDGRRRAVLQAGRARCTRSFRRRTSRSCSTARARRRLRAAADVRAARRHLRDGDRAVLRAGRGGDLRAAQACRTTIRRSACRCYPVVPRAVHPRDAVPAR